MRAALALLLAAVTATSCGGTEEAVPASVLATVPSGEASSVRARFRVTVDREGGASESWDLHFSRSADRVETRETRGDTGEVWLRGASGAVSGHEKVFHRDRRVVEFHAGDLAALRSERRWDLVSCVIDPALLGNGLARVGGTAVAGREAEEFEGAVRGASYRVTWVPSWRLPARLRRTASGETVTFALEEIHPADDGAPAAPDASGYQRIDFADIGDRHTDPFCRQFDRNLGSAWPGGHGGHDHE